MVSAARSFSKKPGAFIEIDAHPSLHRVPLRDGRTLAVAEYGDPAGRPLWFLHGTPGSHLLGGLISEEARRHGFRLLAPDRPGLGYSDPHPGRTYGSFADDLCDALDHFALPRACLVGISGGGPYGLAMAARHPDRLENIVLLSPWWFPHGVPRAEARRALNPMFLAYEWMMRRARFLTGATGWVASRVARAQAPKVVENMIRHAPADDRRLLATPAVQAQLEADVRMAFRQGWRGQWREAQLCFLPPDIDVARITKPITIFHGAQDNIVPLHYSEKLVARLPRGVLRVDPEGGHFVALRLQDETFELLRG